ncbi:GNAT family N-acetyltransferase [Winogradskyella sp.]|uniref:GNAT family N-acetyltransferase n=1 Tax=Winogradskyella sp. TaxID=1883156 RepID=UPI003F6AEDF3
MNYQFKITPKEDLDLVIALVYELDEAKISIENLTSRFNEMITQNYECAGVYVNGKLIGISGLWYCTRHYAGKSVELDHVYIMPEYRNKGLGKEFMDWIQTYVKVKGCQSTELNTYVQNYPSHKFYYNEGYEIWGYHFYKNI